MWQQIDFDVYVFWRFDVINDRPAATFGLTGLEKNIGD